MFIFVASQNRKMCIAAKNKKGFTFSVLGRILPYGESLYFFCMRIKFFITSFVSGIRICVIK